MLTQAESQPARPHQHRNSQHHQHGQQQKPLAQEQSGSSATGENQTRRSSARRSSHHHHHQHGSQHHSESSCSRHQSHSRQHHQTPKGNNHDLNHDSDNSQCDINANAKAIPSARFSLSESNGPSVAPASGAVPLQSSLIDQLLINCSNSKSPQAQTPLKAAAVVAYLQRRSRKQQPCKQLLEVDYTAQGQPLLTTASWRSSSQCRDESTEFSLAGDNFRPSSREEALTGKALAKQWHVSKQFVIANCINCLSQRMRDLQQTDDPVLAQQKLLALRQLRQLTDSVRRIDLTKQLYSTGRRANQVAAAVGLRSDSLSADLLRRWSSRENEYHMYWMALLEKSAASLANRQDVAALQQQLQFAQNLVDVHGFPLR